MDSLLRIDSAYHPLHSATRSPLIPSLDILSLAPSCCKRLSMSSSPMGTHGFLWIPWTGQDHPLPRSPSQTERCFQFPCRSYKTQDETLSPGMGSPSAPIQVTFTWAKGAPTMCCLSLRCFPVSFHRLGQQFFKEIKHSFVSVTSPFIQ